MGLRIGGGTDAHRVMSYNLMASLQWMIDGMNVAGTATREADQTPSREEALRLYTQGWAAKSSMRPDLTRRWRTGTLGNKAFGVVATAPEGAGTLQVSCGNRRQDSAIMRNAFMGLIWRRCSPAFSRPFEAPGFPR